MWRTDRFTESETPDGNRGVPVRPRMLLAIVAKPQSVRFFIQKESSSDLELTASATGVHHGKACAASS
jgi:hypothetical protein